ncbi:hypothetical protein PEBR_03227 [Penicillium brasilianum]|uniref:Uncharacterized protein n=1 Tax=Penicillium brasilianum TaxID=104259 RepID=A0A1S9RYR0_PENBI|nr:hypothetical protein PEBR_03227 [Penicillium brasilianum]
MEKRARRAAELAQQIRNYREAGGPSSADFDSDTLARVDVTLTSGPPPHLPSLESPFPPAWLIDKSVLNKAVREFLRLTSHLSIDNSHLTLTDPPRPLGRVTRSRTSSSILIAPASSVPSPTPSVKTPVLAPEALVPASETLKDILIETPLVETSLTPAPKTPAPATEASVQATRTPTPVNQVFTSTPPFQSVVPVTVIRAPSHIPHINRTAAIRRQPRLIPFQAPSERSVSDPITPLPSVETPEFTLFQAKVASTPSTPSRPIQPSPPRVPPRFLDETNNADRERRYEGSPGRPTAMDTSWKAANIGLFDPSKKYKDGMETIQNICWYSDVHTFIDRMSDLVLLKSEAEDVRAGRTPREYAQGMLRLLKATGCVDVYDQLLRIRQNIEPTLRRDIAEPSEDTGLATFMEGLDKHYQDWKDMASKRQSQLADRSRKNT